MVRIATDAVDLGADFFILVLMPPIMTVLWWLMSRATGAALQGGEMSPRSKRWADGNFWKFMIFLYIIGFSILIYAYLQ